MRPAELLRIREPFESPRELKMGGFQAMAEKELAWALYPREEAEG